MCSVDIGKTPPVRQYGGEPLGFSPDPNGDGIDWLYWLVFCLLSFVIANILVKVVIFLFSLL